MSNISDKNKASVLMHRATDKSKASDLTHRATDKSKASDLTHRATDKSKASDLMHRATDKSKASVLMHTVTNENRTMRVFTGIGILLIVAGHLNAPVLDIFGLYPYYSFHVYIFLFVAGYFYKPEDEKHVGRYILHKAVRLLVPYYVFHLFYGLLSSYLNTKGIYVGGGLSLQSLLVDPFLGGHYYMFDSPAWFVPALFVVETFHIIFRKMMSFIIKNKSVLIYDLTELILLLTVGVIVIALSISGKSWGIYKTFGRWLIMLPGIAFGRIYRSSIQDKVRKVYNKIRCFLLDKKVNDNLIKVMIFCGIYVLLILVQIVISKTCGGTGFSVVWCTGFSNGPIVPYITVITGMAFWYGISSVIANSKEGVLYILSRVVTAVGRHSFAVMEHHFLVLFIINSLFYRICLKDNLVMAKAVDKLAEGALGFDYSLYSTDITYQYLYLGYNMTRICNLILCVLVVTAGAHLLSASLHFCTARVEKKQ